MADAEPRDGGGDGHAHRPGLFKVPQKKHSTGRHRTKRAIARENRGKIGVKALSMQKARDLSKVERRNRSAQLRSNKSAKLMEQRRQEGGAPTLVTVVSLDNSLSAEQLVEQMCAAAEPDGTVQRDERTRMCHLTLPRFRARYTLLCPLTKDGSGSASSLCDVLDALRVSDLLLLHWPLGVECLLGTQERLLNALLAQGAPQRVNVCQGLPKSGKQRDAMRKTLERVMKSWHKEGDRVHSIDNASDALQLLRTLSTAKRSNSNLQRQRPYLVAERVEMIANNEVGEKQGQSSVCTLRISGHLRGTPLSVNRPVHISGLGDFRLSQIDASPDPRPLKANNSKNEMSDSNSSVLARADPAKQQSLDTEIVPDPMDAEQPCPEDELADKFAVPMVKKRIPKGTSEYQASWLIDDENGGEEDTDDGEEESDEEEGNGSEKADFDETMEEESDNERADDAMSASEATEEMGDEDEPMDQADMDRFREAREHQQWPDEVQTPRDRSARERFQRYRGLKSFRTSPWDPKENLPRDYARIYKIVDFRRTRKLALAEARAAFETVEPGEFAHPGSYVTLHIQNVPTQFCEQTLVASHPLVLFGLLRHEHRMSIMNVVLQKHPDTREDAPPIKSKDPLIFQVGHRRFAASAIFSQHTNGQKFKMERFMPAQGAFCTTMLAPITYPPNNVCVFRRTPAGTLELVAHGIVLDANPDRVVLKRTVLAGHPFKVSKRTATVRYMFYNKEDIEWFKPVELYTHAGRHGRIKQSVGTHGLMKCTFDQPLSVQDSVLMNLYKRVFPKWSYEPRVDLRQQQHGPGKNDPIIQTNKGKSVQFRQNSDTADENCLMES